MQCDKCFGRKGNLNMHMRTVHSVSGIKPHKCMQCDKCFAQKGHLYIHLRSVHCSIKAHVCVQCGKCFGLKSTLDSHMWKHSNLMPHHYKQLEKYAVFLSGRKISTGEEFGSAVGQREELNIHTCKDKIYQIPHCPIYLVKSDKSNLGAETFCVTFMI